MRRLVCAPFCGAVPAAAGTAPRGAWEGCARRAALVSLLLMLRFARRAGAVRGVRGIRGIAPVGRPCDGLACLRLFPRWLSGWRYRRSLALRVCACRGHCMV